MKKNHSDLDQLANDVEEVFGDLTNCINDVINIKETKSDVVKSFFSMGGSLANLAFNATSTVVTNTPKLVVAVADVKREIVNDIETGMRELQKQQKEEALEEKIKNLKLKMSSHQISMINDGSEK